MSGQGAYGAAELRRDHQIDFDLVETALNLDLDEQIVPVNMHIHLFFWNGQ